MNFKQAHTSNFRVGRTQPVLYLVIHYTANNGDTAENNVKYFANNPNLAASAHYFVDEKYCLKVYCVYQLRIFAYLLLKIHHILDLI